MKRYKPKRIGRRDLIAAIITDLNLPKNPRKTYNYFTKEQLIELQVKARQYVEK